ncbi:MAG: paraquat-inducible protein A [Betaproteobacteria bacterium]|nr:paraquat-inducible protein A [Betaproteobacteria bacterium]
MGTSAAAGLLACRACGQLSRRPAADAPCRCPRCGARLRTRKPQSVARTWAYLVAAAILYVPANILPVMETRSLFGTQKDTILSGVAYLWTSGSPELAVVVFVASIVVPLLKMGALGYLAWTVQRGAARRRHERSRLFRLVEAVGHWSMLDIFVVALMAALVRLRVLAEIEAGPGAAAFGAVVVLTMLAAMSFDARLIWDHGRHHD